MYMYLGGFVTVTAAGVIGKPNPITLKIKIPKSAIMRQYNI